MASCRRQQSKLDPAPKFSCVKENSEFSQAVVLREDLKRFKKWSSMVGVVLDSRAVALIVSLGEGGMYLVVSC